VNFALDVRYATNHGELLNTATMRAEIARFLRKRTVARTQRENRQFNPNRIDLLRRRRRRSQGIAIGAIVHPNCGFRSKAPRRRSGRAAKSNESLNRRTNCHDEMRMRW
jgi:hypothetical protein